LSDLLDGSNSYPVQVSDEMETNESSLSSSDTSSLSFNYSSTKSKFSFQNEMNQNETNNSVISLPRVPEIDIILNDIESLSHFVPGPQQFRPISNTRGAVNARNYRNREKKREFEEECKLIVKEDENRKLSEIIDNMKMMRDEFYKFLRQS
jgi:hypothetical protein